MKTHIENLDTNIGKQDQNLVLNSYWQLGNHMLRIEIRLNAYSFQSYARIFNLTKVGWEFLYGIPYTHMAVTNNEVGYLNLEKAKPHLEADEKILLDMAKKLLIY